MDPVLTGLVGVGGYARSCLNSIEILEKDGLVALTAVVIRSPQKYPEQTKLLSERGVTIRASLEELLDKDRDKMEMVAIPTGIDSHCRQTIQAAEAGVNVVLEKPSAATIQYLDAMRAALDRTGTFCQVGFQSQSDPVVLELKREICAGRLGTIREIVVTGMWRRSNTYYERNRWAGAFMLDGVYVLDGTINNPLAHYLFNGLFFASTESGKAATPVSVRGELYRGHDIESEDTSCLEVVCDNGARLFFYATLCAAEQTKPAIEIIGDKGCARWSGDGRANLYEGGEQVQEITTPDGVLSRVEVFRNAARYLRGLDSNLTCPLAMTRSHVLAVNGAFESVEWPVSVPPEALDVITDAAEGETHVHIKGIEELIERAATERKLFSDLGVPWAKATQPFSVTDYTQFDLKPPTDSDPQ